MGFFDMGPLEILFILVLALIIWGPGKIPEVARTLGRLVYTLRKTTADLTTAVTREISTADKDRQPPSTTNRPPMEDKTKELSELSDVEKAEPRHYRDSPPEGPARHQQEQ